MQQQIAHMALIVRDYDEAIDFYTIKLQFDLVEDTRLSDTKRWVLVRPKGGTTSLLLARATDEVQQQAIGNQAGGRVFIILKTDNIERDYQQQLKHGIEIVKQPVSEPNGQVCVFADLYGNKWDLIGPAKAS